MVHVEKRKETDAAGKRTEIRTSAAAGAQVEVSCKRPRRTFLERGENVRDPLTTFSAIVDISYLERRLACLMVADYLLQAIEAFNLDIFVLHHNELILLKL